MEEQASKERNEEEEFTREREREERNRVNLRERKREIEIDRDNTRCRIIAKKTISKEDLAFEPSAKRFRRNCSVTEPRAFKDAR